MVYVCLYGFFEAYPIVFGAHGLSLSQIGLTFIPVIVGFFVLLGFVTLFYKRYLGLNRDVKLGLERRGIRDGKIEPEERLLPRKWSSGVQLQPEQSCPSRYWYLQACSGLLGLLRLASVSGP